MAKKRLDAEAELRAAGYRPVPGKKRGHGDHVIWQRGKRTVSGGTGRNAAGSAET
jgi:hypothetical protein